MPRLQSRDEQIAEFWNAVRERLIQRHKRKADQADLGIGRYRGDIERHEIGEAVYNQGVERTAEVVNGVIEYGLPKVRQRKTERRISAERRVDDKP